MLKTSVIIPVYNVEKYLNKCIESVLRQTNEEIEIILIDDGSTDGSKKIVEFYEENYSCVNAIYQENHKLGAARNAGVLKARGEYIYFLDSDDYIKPNLLQKCYLITEQNRLDFIMFDSEVIVEEQNNFNQSILENGYDRKSLVPDNRIFTGKEFWEKYYSGGGVYTNAYLFYINRQFFLENDLFFVPEIFYEDNDWVIRLYQAAQKIMYLPDKLYYRRIRGGSIMTEKYTDVHMRSIAIVCGLHTDMLFRASDKEEIQMIIPRYISVMGRLRSIFQQFTQEREVAIAKREIVELYYKIVNDFQKIWEYDLNAGDVTLAVINMFQRVLPELKVRKDISINMKKVLEKLTGGIPLDKNINMGIYGTGKGCVEFLHIYEKVYGKIPANLFFLDSQKDSGFQFWGFNGYNIKDINNLRLDGVIVTSYLYGEEMEQNVREILTRDIPIVSLPKLPRSLKERI